MKANADLKRDGVHQGIADYLSGPAPSHPSQHTAASRRPASSYAGASGAAGLAGIASKEDRRAGNENLGSLYNKGTGSKLDYGAQRMRLTSADKKDKVMHYEKENNQLKTKGTLLENEITKMRTKLHRIEGLMRSRSKCGDTGESDASAMQRDLENECDELRVQNDEIKEKVRKLNVISRGLAAPSTAAQKTNKYSHVPGKLALSSGGKMSRKYTQEASDMRAQLQINNRKTMELENELQAAGELSGGVTGISGADAIRQEIAAMETQARQVQAEMERCEGDFRTNESIFAQGKNYQAEIQAKIRETNAENEDLKQANFRLHLRTQEVTDLEGELGQIAEERDQIERSIRNVTAEPFLPKDGGQSLAARITQLQTRVNAQTKEAHRLKAVEAEVADDHAAKKAALTVLQAQTKDLAAQHGATLDAFRAEQANHKGPTEQEVGKGLLGADPGKFTTTMTDLYMGGADTAAPIWAKLPFLERATDEADRDKDPKAVLRAEIAKLTQEKSDFAAELEKAESLLRLQTDIEKENTLYFSKEVARLSLIEKSSKAKAEELARRADDKSKSINDLQGQTAAAAGARAGSPSRQHATIDADRMSEFSARTNETELRTDENILEFKVEDAEFYTDNFSQVPGMVAAGDADDGRALVTVVTVDFYNHSTETTQMAEGVRPNYQTQFSFVNAVDNFYVTFLQKNALKMDVYVSRNNAAVLLGRCDILLKPLIEQEVAGLSANGSGCLIQTWAKIYPVAFSVNDKAGSQLEAARPLGVVKYKMRLRKPIQEAMRFYRETNEINNMTRALSINPQAGSSKPVKKLITITVVAAHNLKMKYAAVADVAPFFFYQFYTFEDRYSHNAAGVNPTFNDPCSYEVLFDAKALGYFEKEPLEIYLFDDHAPIAGTAIGENSAQAAGEADDMIGTASIPLNGLVSGCSTHEKYQVKAPGSGTVVGDLEVKLAVMDLETVRQESLYNVVKAAQELHYNKEWEQDVVMRIARKLSTLNCDIELLFGIFSRGQRSCTKEDFKHCCLSRLNLRKENMTERELDLLLMGNEHTRDRDVIERGDFVAIFQGAIIAARNERQNESAFAEEAIRDQSFYSRQSAHTASPQKGDGFYQGNVSASASMLQAYNETEVYELLGEAFIRSGTQYKLLTELYTLRIGGSDTVKSYHMKNLLLRLGGLMDADAVKIIMMLEAPQSQEVNLDKFEDVLNRAKGWMRDRSAVIAKLRTALTSSGKLICGRLEAQDRDGDGCLGLDGFRAALLIGEVRMSAAELEEAFGLICQSENGLAYQDWILNLPEFALYREYFKVLRTRGPDVLQLSQSLGGTGRDNYDGAAHSTIGHVDTSASLIGGEPDQSTLRSAQSKVESYLAAHDISLGVLFQVLDTDSSSAISYAEFKHKVRGLPMRLDDAEIGAIFASLDKNADASVSYGELVEQFAAVNTQQIIGRVRKVLIDSKSDPEVFFRRYSSEDGAANRLTLNELKRMVREIQPKATNLELSYVYKHFDRGNKGYISKEDFMTAFNATVLQKTFALTIGDLMKPLQSEARRHNRNLGALFDKYDADGNGRLSAEELRDALGKNGISLSQDDVRILKEHFQNAYSATEIRKADFESLMRTKYERHFDEAAAKRSLVDVRARLGQMGTSAERVLKEHSPGDPERANLCRFKTAVHSLKCLGQYDIDNLAQYLDTSNTGFIDVHGFAAALGNAAMGASFKSASSRSLGRTGTRSKKWS